MTKLDLAELKAEMVEARDTVRKAHGPPDKDACCETCYILEKLDKWIQGIDAIAATMLKLAEENERLSRWLHEDLDRWMAKRSKAAHKGDPHG